MRQYSMVNATTDADTWESFWTTESVFELRIETKIRVYHSRSFYLLLYQQRRPERDSNPNL